MLLAAMCVDASFLLQMKTKKYAEHFRWVLFYLYVYFLFSNSFFCLRNMIICRFVCWIHVRYVLKKKTLYLEVLYCTVGIKLLVTDNRRSFDIILICTGWLRSCVQGDIGWPFMIILANCWYNSVWSWGIDMQAVIL